MLWVARTSQAALNLSQTPLFISETAPPNIFLLMDDSGSLDWEILPVPRWDLCAYVSYIYADAFLDHFEEEGDEECGQFRATDDLIDRADMFSFPEQGIFRYVVNNPSNLYTATNTSFLAYTSVYDSDIQLKYKYEFSHVVRRLVDGKIMDWRVFDSRFNLVYFNPDREYKPWPGYPDASFYAANEKPDGSGEAIDLRDFVYITSIDDKGFSGERPHYGSDINLTDGANGLIDYWDSHVIHRVKNNWVTRRQRSYTKKYIQSVYGIITGGEVEVSVDNLSRMDDSEEVERIKQNIANWYQYHRKRGYAIQAALAELAQNSPHYRYGFTLFSHAREGEILVPMPEISDDLDAHTQEIVNTILGHELEQNGTPLRQAFSEVGKYFMGAGEDAPIQNQCQLNFVLVTTDGYWNGSGVNLSFIGDADEDGVGSTSLSGPTFADIARYYYNIDLRPDLANDVPTTLFNTNIRQHLSTITLSFGLPTSLTDTTGNGWPNDDSDADLLESSDWTDPFVSATTPNKINDLWHAAYNSRGAFLNVDATHGLVEQLENAINIVDERVGTAAPVNLASGNAKNVFNIYQGRFDSSQWTGDLLSYTISASGVIGGQANWSASQKLEEIEPENRVIIFSHHVAANDTYAGQGFRNNTLPDDWHDALFNVTYPIASLTTNEQYENAFVNYLRGDKMYEGSGWRSRSSRLGDIVHSSPIHVAAPEETLLPYRNDDSYDTFKANYASRSPMVYVGANDGMLHGFDALLGTERLAYIASPLKKNLHLLADPNYAHHYYVDNTPVVRDVYGQFDGVNRWRTVLITGFGAGAKGIAALDITSLDLFSEEFADSVALWEFRAETTANDDGYETTHPDMGHAFGKPALAKLNNGSWGVVVSNGYNSDENSQSMGHAVLFVLDVATGRPIAVIDTLAGGPEDPNGLSEPVLVDTDDDGILDVVYAGDLQGNVWKFDLSDADAENWKVAYTDAGDRPIPLFKTDTGQPITSGITLRRHSLGRGLLLYFGTGRYLTAGDHISTSVSTQAFYSIWDEGIVNDAFNTPLTSSSLLNQSVTFEGSFTPTIRNEDGTYANVGEEIEVRETTAHTIDWEVHRGWRLLLTDASHLGIGERVIAKPQLRNDRVIFNTILVDSNSCSSGGRSWLLELNWESGARPRNVSIDVNGDGKFDKYDYSFVNADGELQCITNACVPVSGLLFNELLNAPAILSILDQEKKYLSGSSGDITSLNENPGFGLLGRQSWKQIYINKG